MKIHIQDLKFKCIIGILDFERVKKQDVIVNLELEYLYEEKFINYADVSQIIKKTMKKKKFELIEDAILSLELKLKKKYKSINTLYIKITKPSILPDCKVSVSNYYAF